MTDDWMTPEQVTLAGWYVTWNREDHASHRPPELVEVWTTPSGVVVADSFHSTYTRLTSEAYAGVLFYGPIVFKERRPKVVKDPHELFRD